MSTPVVELKFSNPTVTAYMDYLSGTESPPAFHAWCIISAAAACMTRRVWFPYGSIKVFPNQFIALVGPPGVRKSTAISASKKLLEDIEAIRFGPDDTAGQRQGLIQCMLGFEEEDDEEQNAKDFGNALEDIAGMSMEDVVNNGTIRKPMDRHALYIAAGELVSFLGIGSLELVTCIGNLWDNPKAYEYSLKTAQTTVPFPSLNILGGITPAHISSALPSEAIGGGFMSRTILVYEDQHKVVAWPEGLDPKKARTFHNIFRWISEVLDGEMTYTPEAKQTIIDLYTYKCKIDDARFIHYKQRRQDHLIKTAMSFCALRNSSEVSADDVLDAHLLLSVTEARMPEALGEYGLSKYALAKARITDVLSNARFPISAGVMFAQIGRDVNQKDFNSALSELLQAERIVQVDLQDPTGAVRPGFIMAKERDQYTGQTINVSYTHDTKRTAGAVAQQNIVAKDTHRAPTLLTQQPSVEQLAVTAEASLPQHSKDADAAKQRVKSNKGKTVLQILRGE